MDYLKEVPFDFLWVKFVSTLSGKMIEPINPVLHFTLTKRYLIALILSNPTNFLQIPSFSLFRFVSRLVLITVLRRGVF